MDIKYKSAKSELIVNSGKMMVEGYISINGNRDLYGDVMLPGAFKKSLEARRKHWNFYHVDDHNFRFHIADCRDIQEDSKGLYFKSEFYAESKAIFEKVEDGTYNGMSFAYAELKSKRERDGDRSTNFIEEVDIIEYSSTEFPVNPLARSAVAAKSLNREMFFEFARNLTDEDAAKLKSLLNGPDKLIKTNLELSAWVDRINGILA